MNIRKKISFLILPAILFLPNIISAQNLGKYGSNIGLGNIFNNITTVMWILFTVIVVICFVLSGIMFLTAMGDAAKLKTARSAFIWGIAGVVVGIIAYSIVLIIENLLFYGA